MLSLVRAVKMEPNTGELPPLTKISYTQSPQKLFVVVVVYKNPEQID